MSHHEITFDKCINKFSSAARHAKTLNGKPRPEIDKCLTLGMITGAVGGGLLTLTLPPNLKTFPRPLPKTDGSKNCPLSPPPPTPENSLKIKGKFNYPTEKDIRIA